MLIGKQIIIDDQIVGASLTAEASSQFTIHATTKDSGFSVTYADKETAEYDFRAIKRYMKKSKANQ